MPIVNPSTFAPADNTLLGLLAASSGSSLVGTIQTGAGAVLRTQQSKNRDFAHIKDYGAVCDGVTDDTASINACLTANPNRTILASGTPLISSTITLSNNIKLVFDGGSQSFPVSYLKKTPGMTTVALVIGAGCEVQGGGVFCVNGSTGGGIQLIGVYARAKYAVVVGSGVAGGVGFRVGDDVGTNTNSWTLDNCGAFGMASHGFYVRDGSGIGPNANAGKASHCAALNNGGDGFRSDRALVNTFDSCSAESNTGWGFRMMEGYGNAIVFGDYEPSNTAGTVLFDTTSNQNAIHAGPLQSGITDNGFLTKRFDRYNGSYKNFTAAFHGSTGATKTGTAVTVVGNTATWASVAHGYANGQTVYIAASGQNNLNGAFVVSNVSANAFDVPIRKDQSSTAAISASGLSVAIQAVGTYSRQVGRYMLDRSDVVFSMDITSSDITNITGNISIILPWTTFTDVNVFQTGQEVTYYSGVTHTGKLVCVINHTGGRLGGIHNSIGSGLAPAQLTAAGLAAATNVVITGRYTFFDELA